MNSTSTQNERSIIVAGNWKMNHGPSETRDFFESLRSAWQSDFARHDLKLAVFPMEMNLQTAIESCIDLPIQIGCQNVHWEKSGAFTGEVSGRALNDLGVHLALVGHSERRQYFGETDETVKKRATSLLEQNFHVVLCIGETQKERESGETETVIRRQLEVGLPDAYSENLTIAYEPVWAIGTGLTATPEQAEEAHAEVRKILSERYGVDAAQKTPILYGGSVKPDNFRELLSCPNIDGGLVGGASLQPESYVDLIKIAASF